MTTLRIGELHGGGLVLGYRCTNRCRHCLYGSGPHRGDGLPENEAALEALLDLLAQRAPRARLHIGGGEPFLHLDLLRRAVAGLLARGLALDYVETNAAWVKDPAHARAVLQDLARVGLRRVLVSLSPFHGEFVPLARTESLIAAAEAVLPAGAFVWISSFVEEFSDEPKDEPLDLEALLAGRGDAWARSLADRYSLVAAGRAGRFYAAHGERLTWQEALSLPAPCRARLADTDHFHVDGQGLYVPGLCAGIALPFREVPGEVDLARYPVLRALLERGLAGLVELARAAGFEPLKGEHYGSPCDLCTDARFALARRSFAGLGPPGFYDHRSVPGYRR